MVFLQNALCWNFVFVAFTKLKQIPSRICDFRLLLLASRKPSSEHPKSQILVVGSIVFEHLLDLSGPKAAPSRPQKRLSKNEIPAKTVL